MVCAWAACHPAPTHPLCLPSGGGGGPIQFPQFFPILLPIYRRREGGILYHSPPCWDVHLWEWVSGRRVKRRRKIMDLTFSIFWDSGSISACLPHHLPCLPLPTTTTSSPARLYACHPTPFLHYCLPYLPCLPTTTSSPSLSLCLLSSMPTREPLSPLFYSLCFIRNIAVAGI